MPDNGRFPEDEFEKRLEDLGAHVEYPPTPDLASNVRERIEAEDRRRSAMPGWVAAAVILLLFLPVLAGLVMSGGGGGSVGGAGSSSSGGGGSPSKSESAPAESPTSTTMEENTSGSGASTDSAASSASGEPAGSAASFGAFEFGDPVSLAEARESSSLLLPKVSGFEQPDKVYVGRSPHGDGFVLVYGARDRLPSLGGTDIGLVLTELDGDAETFLKSGTIADGEEVDIAGERGYWVPNGGGTTSPLGTAERLPGNVLIWDRDGHAFRLQANVEKEEAIRLAESVR